MVVIASYNVKENPQRRSIALPMALDRPAVAMFRLMLEEYFALGRLRDNIVQQAAAALVFELWCHSEFHGADHCRIRLATQTKVFCAPALVIVLAPARFRRNYDRRSYVSSAAWSNAAGSACAAPNSSLASELAWSTLPSRACCSASAQISENCFAPTIAEALPSGCITRTS